MIGRTPDIERILKGIKKRNNGIDREGGSIIGEKKPLGPWDILVIIVFLVGICVWIFDPWGQSGSDIDLEEENLKNELNIILDDLRPIHPHIEDCEKLGENNNISIRGTCLVWFLNDSKIFAPEENIEIRLFDNGSIFWFDRLYDRGIIDYIEPFPSMSLKEITFFIVPTPQKLEHVDTFYYEDFRMTKTYRGKFNIYVVYWPEKKPIGMHSIISNPPDALVPYYYTTMPSIIMYPPSEVIGQETDVLEWIDYLPKVK